MGDCVQILHSGVCFDDFSFVLSGIIKTIMNILWNRMLFLDKLKMSKMKYV